MPAGPDAASACICARSAGGRSSIAASTRAAHRTKPPASHPPRAAPRRPGAARARLGDVPGTPTRPPASALGPRSAPRPCGHHTPGSSRVRACRAVAPSPAWHAPRPARGRRRRERPQRPAAGRQARADAPRASAAPRPYGTPGNAGRPAARAADNRARRRSGRAAAGAAARDRRARRLARIYAQTALRRPVSTHPVSHVNNAYRVGIVHMFVTENVHFSTPSNGPSRGIVGSCRFVVDTGKEMRYAGRVTDCYASIVFLRSRRYDTRNGC